MAGKRNYPDTTGDGGLFAALGGAALCFLVLLCIAALLGHWWGDSARNTTITVGLLVIGGALSILALVRTGR
ncbi:MAG: hypothetical protein ACRDZY_00745 [Acidimicrobiales bacterium]